MTDLEFSCRDVRAERYAVAPTLAFDLGVSERSGVRVHAIALRCQLRIEPHKRHYSDEEAAGLTELFGERWRWDETLKPLQFAQAGTVVPAFVGDIGVTLPVPCTYDIDVATAKYFHALRDGNVPLLLLFSGTVFIQGEGGLQIDQVPWDREAQVGLPVRVWRELMELHFPDSGYLRLRSETLHELQRFKSRLAVATWDEAFRLLLDKAGEGQQ